MFRFLAFIAITALSFNLSAASNASCCNDFVAKNAHCLTGPVNIFPKSAAKLDAGTIIYFETTTALNSREVTIGTMVPFRVTTNVMAEKHAVITTGTQAMGRITKITKATFNSPEVIEITVKYVQAIDGTQVSLSTNPVRIRETFLVVCQADFFR